MDLRQVEYVVGVVEHGGFTRGAAALHVAQPSLSQAVRRLEDELGAPLFARVGRRVELTPAGDAFLGPARQMLRAALEARGAVSAHVELVAGGLDLAALPTLVAEPLAGMIGTFRSRHPAVVVRVAETTSPHGVLELLRHGQCEIALTEAAGTVGDLVRIELGDQELMAVLPPGRVVDGRRFALGSLAAEALVLSPPGTSIRDLIETAFATIGATPVVAVETAQREAIIPLVVAGAGATVLPAPLAFDAEARGATIAGLEPRLWRTIGLVHRPRGLSPAARAFLDVAVAAGAGRQGSS
ncbi:MAG: LysR family transcriptional regulator [Acidimicrobiia bacterium]